VARLDVTFCIMWHRADILQRHSTAGAAAASESDDRTTVLCLDGCLDGVVMLT